MARINCPRAVSVLMAALLPASEGVLVAHWDFEEGSGTVAARDGSAGAANDPINGSVATDYNWNAFGAPNGGSGSIRFTGGDGRVVSSYLGVGGSNTRTVALWIRTSVSGSSQAFVSWGDSGNNGTKWHVRMNDNPSNGQEGALRTEIQGSFEIATTPLGDGAWHHLASVYDAGGAFGSGEVRHYIDGALVATSGTGANNVPVNTTLVGAGAHTTPVWIGARNQGGSIASFTGDLDEVRIYDHALSLEEIEALAIPEPSSLLLLGMGAAGLLRRRRA